MLERGPVNTHIAPARDQYGRPAQLGNQSAEQIGSREERMHYRHTLGSKDSRQLQGCAECLDVVHSADRKQMDRAVVCRRIDPVRIRSKGSDRASVTVRGQMPDDLVQHSFGAPVLRVEDVDQEQNVYRFHLWEMAWTSQGRRNILGNAR